MGFFRAVRIARVIATGVVAGVLAEPAGASLKWDSIVVTLQAKLGEETVQVRFPFSNPELQPITVVDLIPSCRCTVATLEQGKKTYATRENGALIALLDTTGLSGLQEKTIHVFTDDSSHPTTLTFRVMIPAWLEVTPQSLGWSVGEEAAAKEITLALNPDAAIRITSVKSDNDQVSVTAQPMEGTGRYRLIAKPASTAAPMLATVTIALEIPGGATRNQLVLVQVR